MVPAPEQDEVESGRQRGKEEEKGEEQMGRRRKRAGETRKWRARERTCPLVVREWLCCAGVVVLCWCDSGAWVRLSAEAVVVFRGRGCGVRVWMGCALPWFDSQHIDSKTPGAALGYVEWSIKTRQCHKIWRAQTRFTGFGVRVVFFDLGGVIHDLCCTARGRQLRVCVPGNGGRRGLCCPVSTAWSLAPGTPRRTMSVTRIAFLSDHHCKAHAGGNERFARPGAGLSWLRPPSQPTRPGAATRRQLLASCVSAFAVGCWLSGFGFRGPRPELGVHGAASLSSVWDFDCGSRRSSLVLHGLGLRFLFEASWLGLRVVGSRLSGFRSSGVQGFGAGGDQGSGRGG
eukprot:1217328-Rhodomonas_salina.1